MSNNAEKWSMCSVSSSDEEIEKVANKIVVIEIDETSDVEDQTSAKTALDATEEPEERRPSSPTDECNETSAADSKNDTSANTAPEVQPSQSLFREKIEENKLLREIVRCQENQLSVLSRDCIDHLKLNEKLRLNAKKYARQLSATKVTMKNYRIGFAIAMILLFLFTLNACKSLAFLFAFPALVLIFAPEVRDMLQNSTPYMERFNNGWTSFRRFIHFC